MRMRATRTRTGSHTRLGQDTWVKSPKKGAARPSPDASCIYLPREFERCHHPLRGFHSAQVRLMRRILRIVVGNLAASFVAGFVISIALALKLSSDLGQGSRLALAGTVLFGVYVAFLALLPGICGIIYAERTGGRSVLFYAAGGNLAGIVAYGLYALILVVSAGTAKDFLGGRPLVAHAISVALLFGGPGLVGGLVYWLIAGRSASRGREGNCRGRLTHCNAETSAVQHSM
jgi:hypothetical protein